MDPGELNLEITRGVDSPIIRLTCKNSIGNAVPLAGWTAYAHVRKASGAPLILDLAPVIEDDDSAGLVTIPSIPWADTEDLTPGTFYWDLLLEDPDGIRQGPILAGSFVISNPKTKPVITTP